MNSYKKLIKYVISDTYGHKEEISIEVSPSVEEALAASDRKQNALDRQERRHKADQELPETLHDPLDIEQTVISRLESEALHKALNELTDVQRRRVIMRFFNAMTYRDIAKEEGVRVKQIEKSIDAALVKLKKIL